VLDVWNLFLTAQLFQRINLFLYTSSANNNNGGGGGGGGDDNNMNSDNYTCSNNE
jgi:hypothetical protein